MKQANKDPIVKNGVDSTILLNELRAAAKPLQDFLAKYYDLETIAIVDIMYASIKATRIGAKNTDKFENAIENIEKRVTELEQNSATLNVTEAIEQINKKITEVF